MRALLVVLFALVTVTACDGGGGGYNHHPRHGTTCHTTVQRSNGHTRTIRTCHHY